MTAARRGSQTQMAGGLTVIDSPIATSGMVGIVLVSKQGIRDGSDADAAALSLLAAAFFRGTADTPSDDDIMARLEDLGAEFNASVSSYCTAIEVIAPADQAQAVIAVLSELVNRPAYDLDQIDSALQRHLNDIETSSASPSGYLEEHLNESLYTPGTSLARPASGDPALIATVGAAELAAAHRRVFDPSQLAVVISGGASISAADLDAAFGQAPAAPPRLARAAAQPRPRGEASVTVRPTQTGETPMITFAISAPIPTPASLHDAAVLTMFNAVMSGGASTRLFATVRERNGLAYSISSHIQREPDDAHYVIESWMTPTNAPRGIALAIEQLRQVAEAPTSAGGLAASEMSKARAQASARIAAWSGTAEDRSKMTAMRWANGSPTASPAQLIAELSTVSEDEVRGAARTVIGALERAHITAVAPTNVGPSLRRIVVNSQREVA